MDLDLFIVAAYSLIDERMSELLDGQRLRSRGPEPLLDDREVLTMEIVGEFLGLDTDKAIHLFFKRHYSEWFPALRRVHRTTFARQGANLWKVKEMLRDELLSDIERDPRLCVVDSFPIPVCSFAKASRCKRFRGVASRGYDAMAKSVFYGLKGHLRVVWPGVIAEASLAPANVHDRWVLEEDLLGQALAPGWIVGDTNYWSPLLKEDLLRRCDLALLAPKRENTKRRKHPWPRWLVALRRRVETVGSQLVERYHLKRVWARDEWHLTSRFLRKLLSHTVAVLLCQHQGLSPLRFSELLVD